MIGEKEKSGIREIMRIPKVLAEQSVDYGIYQHVCSIAIEAIDKLCGEDGMRYAGDCLREDLIAKGAIDENGNPTFDMGDIDV